MRFIIHQSHNNLVSEEFDLSSCRVFFLNEALEETDFLGFTIEDYPEDADFRIHLGDKQLPSAAYHRRFIEWEKSQYLSNCIGKVPVILEARSKDSIIWRPVCSGEVICYPSKISRRQYKKMLQDISIISRGLILDIVSKTNSLFGWVATKSIDELSGVEEYFLINQFLTRFEPILERINIDPGNRLTVTNIQSLCYGQENFTPKSLAQISRSGADPRKKGSNRPFQCEIQRKERTFDIWENRQIAALCSWVANRLSFVANKAQIQIDTIKRDKQWRQIAPKGKMPLWDIEDAPRIAQLEASVDSCRKIQRRVSLYPKRFGFLEGVGVTKLDLKPTPKFTKDLFYSHAYVAMVDFISNNGIMFDSGKFEQKLKETSKLYEYWVYIIFFFYLKERFPLSVVSEAPFLNLSANRDQYVMDINSGDHIVFSAQNGLRIVIHYEPKFMSRNDAEDIGSRLFRSSLRGKRPLVPDLLIEILSGPAESPKLEYGIVIDCKYTTRIHEVHWNEVEKYQSQLFERIGLQNVANQLWIIHPGERPYWQINIPGGSIEDTVRIPNSTVQGVLSLAPTMNEKIQGSLDHHFDQLDDSIGRIIQMFVERK
jgi:hypothetical protein